MPRRDVRASTFITVIGPIWTNMPKTRSTPGRSQTVIANETPGVERALPERPGLHRGGAYPTDAIGVRRSDVLADWRRYLILNRHVTM